MEVMKVCKLSDHGLQSPISQSPWFTWDFTGTLPQQTDARGTAQAELGQNLVGLTTEGTVRDTA